jgi:hypothetical protein
MVSSRSRYDGPVDELGASRDQISESHETGEARNQLLEHVGLAWCLKVAGSDALLDRLFSEAMGIDRAALIRWIGLTVLRHDEMRELAGDVAPRLPGLWARRLDGLRGKGNDPELMGYGWWYSSGKLAEPEGTDLVVQTLKATNGRMDDVRGCLARVTEVAANNPSGACDMLAAVVAGEDRDRSGSSGTV